MGEIRSAVAVVEDRGRQGPGRLQGMMVPFGAVASDRREVFRPDSITMPANGVALTLGHGGRQVDRVIPTVDARGVHVDHVLPDTQEGRDAARRVRAGELRGLSVEFHPLRETRTHGVREVVSALVSAAALVPNAAYGPHTGVEVRAADDLEFWT